MRGPPQEGKAGRGRAAAVGEGGSGALPFRHTRPISVSDSAYTGAFETG